MSVDFASGQSNKIRYCLVEPTRNSGLCEEVPMGNSKRKHLLRDEERGFLFKRAYQNIMVCLTMSSLEVERDVLTTQC